LNLRVTESEWEEINGTGVQDFPFPSKRNNTPLWNAILEGLKLFNIPEEHVLNIAPIQIQLTFAEETLKILSQLPYRRGTTYHPLAFLIGDAAFRVHFWPGRGLNSAIKGAIALSRRVYHAYTAKQNSKGALRPGDFSFFSGFMTALRLREHEGRSFPMLDVPVVEALTQGFSPQSIQDWKVLRRRFKEVMQGMKGTLEARQDWPHKIKITNEAIEAVFDRLHPYTINVLVHTGTWPLQKMAGEEIYPRKLCPDPLSPKKKKDL